MGIAYNTSVVRDGLVLHLDAANPKSYPGTGTVWSDLSGSGNTGAMSNTTFDSSSILFDAANDYVQIPHAANLNFSSSFTVSAWINANSFVTGIYNIISKKPSFNNTRKGWSCQYDYRLPGVLQYRNNDGSVLNDSTPTSSLNNRPLFSQSTTWVNPVWVISSTNVSFYANGSILSTAGIGFNNTDTTTPIYIGKSSGSSGDPALLSNISNVKIYNRQLTADEIQKNFEATRGRYGI
jgi:hypothetical protein